MSATITNRALRIDMASARAAPIPAPAPVTMATFPSISMDPQSLQECSYLDDTLLR